MKKVGSDGIKVEKVAINHLKNPMMDDPANQKALKAFLKYCKVHCGWFPYSEENPEQVEICLENFKKDKDMLQFAEYFS